MVEPAFGSSGQRYVRWAAAMAVNLQTGVPWTMCKQNDAPDPVVGIHSHTTAMGLSVEKHLLDQTQLISLHCGQKIGPLAILYTVMTQN